MDIRRFFGSIPTGRNKSSNETASKSADLDSTKTFGKDDKPRGKNTTNRNKDSKSNKGVIKKKDNKSIEISDDDDKNHNQIDVAKGDNHSNTDISMCDSKKRKHLSGDRPRSTRDLDTSQTKKLTRLRSYTSLSSDDDIDSKTKRSKYIDKPAHQTRTKKGKSAWDVFTVSPEDVCPKKKKHTSGSIKMSKRTILSDSEEEEEPEEPVPKKNKKEKSRYKSVVLASDSDSETPIKSSPLDSFLKPISKNTDKVKEKEKVDKNVTSVDDFFGSSSIKRKERLSASFKSPSQSAKPGCEHSQVLKEIERSTDIIDDDDKLFMETLAQLDHKKKSEKKSPPTDSFLGHSFTDIKSSTTSTNHKQLNEPSSCLNRTPSTKDMSPIKQAPIRTSDPLLATETRRSPRKVASSSCDLKQASVKTVADSINSSEKTPLADKIAKNKSPNEDITGSKSDSSRKSGGGVGYRQWLNREGPCSLGSKPFPQGGENCLEDLTFVVTGVLDSFDRDDIKRMIETHGGKITQSLSRKTSYLVVGRDPGEGKLLKAKQLNLKQIDEDGLLALIKELPGKKSKYHLEAERRIAEENKAKTSNPVKDKIVLSKGQESRITTGNTGISAPSLLWVDKYKPNSTKKVIGQQGEKSNAVKLQKWLTEWHKNRALGKKPSGSMWGKDDGSGYKAVLLSGPPGVGKTTTAQLVCQESQFSYVELNASDTRSKRTLREVVAECLDNRTLIDYIDSNRGSKSGHHHCIIMDEVDGVAGNEDRGGIQELIDLIKHTHIPIICICNDRSHQKMRSLVNHCFDLRFYRPRVEQIKGAMMTLLHKEGLTLPPFTLNEIILASNQDVRQIIHNLSVICSKDRDASSADARAQSYQIKKDFKLGPFDICRKVFVDDDEKRHMTLMDKSDLFFHDYSFGPLFVHENYMKVSPHLTRGGGMKEHLSRLARAADSLGDGDIGDRLVRQHGEWSLLPSLAMYLSVIPGEHMRGYVNFQIAFPSWLGKNSATNKTDRILQELSSHMRLKINGSKGVVGRDYLPYMRQIIAHPLRTREADGVKDVIDLLDGYDLLKEDFDNIMEISKWPNYDDPIAKLSSKTKAALTRTYNKGQHLTPYAVSSAPKKQRHMNAMSDELGYEGDEDAVVSGDEGNDDLDDLSAFTTKPSKEKKVGTSAAKGTSTKGKSAGGSSKGKKVKH